VSIRELAGVIMNVVGFAGRCVFDASKPDGTPRKLGDISKITALGWRPRIGLRDGVASTYRWFLDNIAGRGLNRAPEAAKARA